MYLFEKIDVLRDAGNLFDDNLPSYISDNLNKRFDIREYQKQAFQNFIYYYEKSNFVTKPTQTLFHMATGSGKTLIMAGLILYLYKKGYRDFLFFVNSTTIINKTKSNFLDSLSSKYLFDNEINIDGERIKIKEVDNFQDSDDNCINICFQTIQGLHMNINYPRENSLTIEDFESKDVVLISDEAHHLNAMTTSGRLDKAEQENLNNWEYTVERLFHSNINNILLEFTATCDIENDSINAKYVDKIIFNYPLSKFREDGYSKEVETLQSNVDMKNKMLQAVLLSQYRLKVFQDYKIDVKPVVLFKSDTIINSKNNLELFNSIIEHLSEDDILKIKENSSNEVLINMFSYFEENNIDIKNLLLEIKDDFSTNKCLSVNNEEDAIDVQMIVNTLEDKTNQYRAIFEVKMLDEGWDVLNLFDIVRLYETRDGRNGRPGNKTIQEAQLIGRGARYYPFVIDEGQDQYTRKYDNDIENPLRICETLLYHCQLEPRYISELKIALKETGIIPEEVTKVTYRLKDEFKKTKFYREGLVFYNERKVRDRNAVSSIPESLRCETHSYVFGSGRSKIESLFTETLSARNIEENLHETVLTISEIAKSNYNLVYTAYSKFNMLKFNILKQYFPNLKTVEEFLTSKDYLGNIKISINCIYTEPTLEMVFNSVVNVLNSIKDRLLKYEDVYVGTTLFSSKRFNEVFRDKVCNISVVNNDSVGVSQNDVNDSSYRLDLSDKNWFVYNDNYGTTEEKKFVKYFSDNIQIVINKYERVYLVRNERELPIYSFTDGERFEPDYLLFIIDERSDKPKQYQIFIEPKGGHLLQQDKWKEDFLKSLNEKAIPTTKFVENTDYLIWGFPFYNSQYRTEEFSTEFNKLKEI